MIDGKTSIGSILSVNGHFLRAALLSYAAWLLWPTSPEWWGFSLLSLLLGIAAFSSIVMAILAMSKIYVRERTVARFSANARRPMPSDLADQDALKQAGMIND